MKNMFLLCTAIAFVLAGCASNTSELAYLSDTDRAVHQKLETLINVDYKAEPLFKVLADLQQRTGVSIHPDWKSLAAADVEKDTPITMSLINAPASTVLELIIKQAGAGAELEPLAAFVRKGIVMVSTKRELDRDTIVQVYDIRDLLTAEPAFRRAPEFDLNSALS